MNRYLAIIASSVLAIGLTAGFAQGGKGGGGGTSPSKGSGQGGGSEPKGGGQPKGGGAPNLPPQRSDDKPTPKPRSDDQGGPKPQPQPNPSPQPKPQPGGQGAPPPRPDSDPKPLGRPNSDPRIQPQGNLGRPERGGDYLRKGNDYLGKRNDQRPAFSSRTGGIPAGGKIHNQGREVRDGIGKGIVPVPTGTIVPRPVNDGIGRGLGTGGNNSGRTGGRGSLGYQVGRQEDYRVGLRSGYYHYDPLWCDWFFGYRFYCWEPVFGSWFSPYYIYYSVPGYLSFGRGYYRGFTTIIVIGNPIAWNYCGRGYNYGYYNYSNYGYDRNYSQVDRALSDLQDAFKYSDAKLLDRLIPRYGDVEIFIDGDYAYSLNANDYYDITADLIYSVNTTSFQISEVKRISGGGYVVLARHDYVDSWNSRQSNWLTFTLREERGSYVITQAGTSRLRPNF